MKVHGPFLIIFEQFRELSVRTPEAESVATVEVFNRGRVGRKTNTFRHDAVVSLSHLGIDVLLVEAAKSSDFKKRAEDRSKLQIGLTCALLQMYWTLPEWIRPRFKDLSAYGILMAGKHSDLNAVLPQLLSKTYPVLS